MRSVDGNVYAALSNLRINNINNIIVAHLNINSFRNKFEMLSDFMSGKINILLISETKLDDAFPSLNFKIAGYSSPFRLDSSRYGGGLILFIREDIPSKHLNSINSLNICECFFVQINLGRK